MRTGLIAKKVGMTSFYSETGEEMAVTILQVENCKVVAKKAKDKDGYTAVQLGFGKAKVKNTTKAIKIQLQKYPIPKPTKPAIIIKNNKSRKSCLANVHKLL